MVQVGTEMHRWFAAYCKLNPYDSKFFFAMNRVIKYCSACRGFKVVYWFAKGTNSRKDPSNAESYLHICIEPSILREQTT